MNIHVVLSCVTTYRRRFISVFTHADRQSVNISVTDCFFDVILCVFVRLRISPPRIKLAASNFARWLIGVLGKESQILGELCSPRRSPRSPESDESAGMRPIRPARWPRVRSACIDIRPSTKTDVLILIFTAVCHVTSEQYFPEFLMHFAYVSGSDISPTVCGELFSECVEYKVISYKRRFYGPLSQGTMCCLGALMYFRRQKTPIGFMQFVAVIWMMIHEREL